MMQALTTVKLYGRFGVTFGRSFRLAVSTPAEALRALAAQLPGFEQYLTEAKDKGMGFAVFIGKDNLKEDQLDWPAYGQEIRFAPVLLGSKKGGVFNIILGVVLVVVGVIVTGMTFGGAAPLGGAMISAGIGLIVGGVAQMLAPNPKGNGAGDRPENRPSYSFNGPINTQAQGNPVPVAYGEVICGSAVISAGITSEDQVYVPTGTAAGGGGVGSGGGGGGGAAPWHGEWLTA